MAAIINTNVASLNAQRNLSSSQSSLATSLQRLSTGLRINSAKDDAAGLAISERFSSQIRGLNVASRNANDAISLSQTAEGALTEVSNNLQRIRELAVQASNATNSQSDRNALQAEVTQLRDEIDRVASSTKFNGVSLLNGSFTAQAFQVGANAGDTITIASIADVSTATLGGTTSVYTATVDASAITGFTTTIAAGGVTINGTDIGAIGGASSATERASQMAAAINRVSASTGVSATFDAGTNDLILRGTAQFAIAGTTNLATVAGFANAPTAGTATNMNGVTAADVSGYSNAQLTISMMDQALTTVNSARASLGAYQNRFTSTIANLQTASENLSASRSRIQDADFAAETANLTKAQILQQAGTAMLAQANALPQNVLSLLQG